MKPLTWGDEIKKRVRSLLDALLSYEQWTQERFVVPGHQSKWQDRDSKSPRLVVGTKLRYLKELVKKQGCRELSKLKKPDEFLRGAIARLEELGLLQDNRLKDQGSEDWAFTLMLCSKDKAANLKEFDERWEGHRPSKSKAQTSAQQGVGTQDLPEPPPPPTPDQLWEQLKDKATPTEKMGPVLVQRGKTLDMWTTPSQYPQDVPLGSQIRFEVNLESGGYLLLLEKGTSGNLWCLCPSFLAPQPHQPAGVATLPQEKSPHKLLTISGMAGKEEIVALIAKESPPLDWLPQGTQPPLQLKKDHLNDLLAYLNRRPDCQVLYTEYTVTA